jgi:hypothetical protein
VVAAEALTAFFRRYAAAIATERQEQELSPT